MLVHKHKQTSMIPHLINPAMLTLAQLQPILITEIILTITTKPAHHQVTIITVTKELKYLQMHVKNMVLKIILLIMGY